jgi:hypothetical protein
MAASARCYKHPPRTWIAACDDCTTWHLAELEIAASATPVRDESSDRRPRRLRPAA